MEKIYKESVQVGRDVIENVEYLVYGHDDADWCDLTLWDIITIPFYAIKYKVKEIYGKIRYGFQRMFKGYDNVDTFEIFQSFIDKYSKILADYKKNHFGFCWEMTEEEWDNVIDDMIYHLHYMDEDNVVEELEKDVPENWHVNAVFIRNIVDSHKDEFFKLFSKYFYELLD